MTPVAENNTPLNASEEQEASDGLSAANGGARNSSRVPEGIDSATIETQSAGRQIARAASMVMIAFIVSNLVGVVRGMVITRAFGTSADLDSFNAANRITELLFNLMAGGALGSAFIPMFTGYLTREDKKGAWRLASGVLNVLTLVLIFVSILVWIFAPGIVKNGLFVLAPGSDPVRLDQTVRLLRIMLPTVTIFGLSGLVMGMLNAHQIFFIPALAPALYSLGMILGTLLLPKSWGIDRLAVGVVIGALGHLFVQLPSLRKLPSRTYQASVGIKDKAVRQVLRLMLPRMVGAGVVQLNFVANTVIALGLGEGSASAVSLAFTLMLMPQTAIAQSAGIASLPTLSAQVEKGQYDEFRATLSGIIRGVMLLAIPAAIGMILLRVPLVQVLYEGGAFDAHSTQMVAWALMWYSAGLVGHCLVEVLSRAFYALHNTKTPVLVGVAAMSLNIALSFALSSLFERVGWMPHGGLALANSLATSLESAVLLLLIRKRLNGLGGRQIGQSALAALAGTAVMGATVYAWVTFMLGGSRVVILLVGVVLGVGVYGLMMWLLRVPELRSIIAALRSKLGKNRVEQV
ncbi:MAG: murein biosynthesis integral membrane protein MurJ [Anaerolineaceae bacterium]